MGTRAHAARLALLEAALAKAKEGLTNAKSVLRDLGKKPIADETNQAALDEWTTKETAATSKVTQMTTAVENAQTALDNYKPKGTNTA